MIRLYFVFILVCASCAVLIGSPCWSHQNTCGDAPACGTGEPPAGASETSCHHIYCDDGQTCPWDSGLKQMMITQRKKYSWEEGEVVRYCVGAPDTYPWGAFCCLCAQPGVLYSQ